MREILSESISPEGTVDILFKRIDFIGDMLLLIAYNIKCSKHKNNLKI